MKSARPFMVVSAGLCLAFAIALLQFVFNPLGLGPVPEAVLPPDFFEHPARDLSGLELLVDGREAFGEIFAHIDSAQSSIYVQTFIWKDDATGKTVADKLKSAADRGVKVTVSKDMLGTFFELGDLIRRRPSPVFTGAGLKGHRNIEVNTNLLAKTDHSKYFIFDQDSVIFGGMNIADEYHLRWHDYMVLFRGKTWTRIFSDRVLRHLPWPRTSPLMLAVNDEKGTEIRTATIEVIDRAEKSLVIEHAYFSDDRVIQAVGRAAARGLEVDVILPKVPDTHLYANLATINRLLEAEPEKAPRIFLNPHMSHAKVILADGKIAAVGSANLTPRSMITSKEITLFVHGTPDLPFLRDLRAQLEADKAVSEEVVEPFKLGLLDKAGAVGGKYLW